MKHFDAVVIGSGQGGTPLAKKLAKAGFKTALIERTLVGGTCINNGCTPTKTMIASAKAAYNVANAGKMGVETGAYKINMATILARKNDVVGRFRGAAENGIEETPKLSLIFGEASFESDTQLSIAMNDGGTETITAEKIFINAGATPTIPDIHGLKDIEYLTSTTMLELAEIPEHLVIIGGSYIALEFGQMYRRFGSKVTILETAERFLGREDEDVAEVIHQFLADEGIEIKTGIKINKIEKENKITRLSIADGEKETTINCSHLLIAAGRTPNTKALNLEAAGMKTDDKGHIIVNEYLETNIPNIYALGDIKGGPEFTHIAYNDNIIIAGNILHNQNKSTKDRMVPYCMFTDPQLGRVGITEREARKQGRDIKVAKLPMDNVARAIEAGDTRGLMKAVIDAATGQIIGVAIVGEEGGEIMTVLQMAMVAGIGYKQLASMVIAHPLYAESINNLFMQLD